MSLETQKSPSILKLEVACRERKQELESIEILKEGIDVVFGPLGSGV